MMLLLLTVQRKVVLQDFKALSIILQGDKNQLFTVKCGPVKKDITILINTTYPPRISSHCLSAQQAQLYLTFTCDSMVHLSCFSCQPHR